MQVLCCACKENFKLKSTFILEFSFFLGRKSSQRCYKILFSIHAKKSNYKMWPLFSLKMIYLYYSRTPCTKWKFQRPIFLSKLLINPNFEIMGILFYIWWICLNCFFFTLLFYSYVLLKLIRQEWNSFTSTSFRFGNWCCQSK